MDIKNETQTHNGNSFYGSVNLGDSAQIAAGNINNVIVPPPSNFAQQASYEPVPIWRSPFTLALLSWLSLFFAVFDVSAIIPMIGSIFQASKQPPQTSNVLILFIVFIILSLLLILVLSLRQIAKRQTRHPLILNFAINGGGNRLTLEKIHVGKCPQCGGKMRYYNKPIEWNVVSYSDGTTKKAVTKRHPVLECTRNPEHFYMVDPAEDKIS